MRNIKIRTESYFFETLPSERRSEIVNEALACQLHTVIEGSDTVDTFIRALKAHARWAFLRHLPMASLIQVAAQYGEAPAASGPLSSSSSPASNSNAGIPGVERSMEHTGATPSAGLRPSPFATAAQPRTARAKGRRARAKPAASPESAAASQAARTSRKAVERPTNGLEQRLLGAIRANPGIRVGDLLTKVGGDKGKMKTALTHLREEGKVTVTGIKRGMVYSITED